MDRREELKTKAREHERNNQPEHALKIYSSLLPDISGASLGVLLTRTGDLQEKIGSPAAAAESFARAADTFVAAGQPNNAIAVTQRRLQLEPDEPNCQLILGELALAQGLKDFARTAIAAYARHSAAAGAPEQAVAPFASYLAKYPDEAEQWGEWEDELAADVAPEKIAPFVDRLLEHLEAGGNGEAAEGIARARSRAQRDGEDRRGGEVDGPPTADGDTNLELRTATASVSDPISEPLESAVSEGYGFDGRSEEDAQPLPGHRPELEGAAHDSVEAAQDRVRMPGVEHADSAQVDLSSDRAAIADIDSDDNLPPAPETPLTAAGMAESDPLAGSFDPTPITSALRAHAGVEIEPVDAASHYDLGLAFREMGRFDESIANLAMAMQAGHDPAATMEVVGEILVERGEHSLAAALLRRLPGVDGPVVPEYVGVHYWLARAAEKAGRHQEARSVLRHIVSVDPTFRDAADRLQDLQ